MTVRSGKYQPELRERVTESSVSPSDPATYAAQIVQGTNEVRRAKGLPTLGGVIADCASGTTAAENLSKAAATPTAVIDAWMHSPGHRSNLLDPSLTETGVGCVWTASRCCVRRCSWVLYRPQ